MPGLTHELASLIFEVVGILGAVGVVSLLLRSSGQTKRDLRLISAAVIGGIAVAFAFGNLADAGSALSQARRNGVGPRAGLERCLEEDGGEELVPFFNWVKARLPPRAVYELATYSGHPDLWCVTLVLLPSLLAGPGGQPGWIITLGTLPPDLQARIARHDPSVRVFAPGFALARGGPG